MQGYFSPKIIFVVAIAETDLKSCLYLALNASKGQKDENKRNVEISNYNNGLQH